MQTKTITYQAATISYRIAGKGNPVVFLHGFGEDSAIWDEQIQSLQNNFYLIIPDLPGSGRSTFIDNATIETYAEIIKLIIDTEAIQQCSIIGHSLGGYITLAFAEKFSSSLNSFGLFHSSAFADNEEKIQTRRKAIEFVKSHGAYNFLKTSIPGLFYNQEDPSSIVHINELVEKGKNFTNEAIIQYYEAMIKRPDRTTILKNFSKPVLFIMGEYDKAVPLQSSLQQCHFPPIAYVHVLQRSAHMGMLEETEKCNGILLNFLNLTD